VDSDAAAAGRVAPCGAALSAALRPAVLGRGVSAGHVRGQHAADDRRAGAGVPALPAAAVPGHRAGGVGGGLRWPGGRPGATRPGARGGATARRDDLVQPPRPPRRLRRRHAPACPVPPGSSLAARRRCCNACAAPAMRRAQRADRPAIDAARPNPPPAADETRPATAQPPDAAAKRTRP
jgi:hypothetical protein